MLDVKALLTKILTMLTTLNTHQTDTFKLVYNVTLPSSGSIAAGGNCAVKTMNVSSKIPSGYSLLAAVPRGTQNANLVWWYFDYYGTTVEYRLRNVGSSAVTVSPTANLICVKSKSL